MLHRTEYLAMMTGQRMLLVLALSLCLSLAGCSDEPDSAKQTIDDLTFF